MRTFSSIRPVTVADRIQWDHLAHHPLQSWAWGEFRTSMGIDVVRLVIEHNKKIIDAWQVTFHKIPYTPWMIGYFPKGPTITREMLVALETLVKQKHAIFIQLEPNVLASTKLRSYEATKILPSHHPLFTKYTFVLDLTKSEEELLRAMHSKTRYNIKVAQKHGVIVKEDNSNQAFEAYLQLNQETTTRQRFYAHSQIYHQTMWNILSRSKIAHLWTATYQGEILAAWIIFLWKDTMYYPYGASSREHRDVMAPNLLLWEIAKWGKSHGFKKFDLWGALGPPPAGGPDEHNPWYGFHRFKQGFNPNLVEFVGSYDLVINPLLYRIYTIADTIRWSMLKK